MSSCVSHRLLVLGHKTQVQQPFRTGRRRSRLKYGMPKWFMLRAMIWFSSWKLAG